MVVSPELGHERIGFFIMHCGEHSLDKAVVFLRIDVSTVFEEVALSKVRSSVPSVFIIGFRHGANSL